MIDDLTGSCELEEECVWQALTLSAPGYVVGEGCGLIRSDEQEAESK